MLSWQDFHIAITGTHIWMNHIHVQYDLWHCTLWAAELTACTWLGLCQQIRFSRCKLCFSTLLCPTNPVLASLHLVQSWSSSMVTQVENELSNEIEGITQPLDKCVSQQKGKNKRWHQQKWWSRKFQKSLPQQKQKINWQNCQNQLCFWTLEPSQKFETSREIFKKKTAKFKYESFVSF